MAGSLTIGLRPATALPWRIALGLLALLVSAPADAFSIQNTTARTDVQAKVSGGGSFGSGGYVAIPANDAVFCSYAEPSCTGEADRVAAGAKQVTVEIQAETFDCVLPMLGGGYVVFAEENRFPLVANVPNGFYCESRRPDGSVLEQQPYGVHATARDVRFLVTADPQYDGNDWNSPCDLTKGCDPKDFSDANTTLTTMIGMIQSTPQIRGAIVAGDLAHNTQAREFDHYKAMIAGSARFFFDGVGNHDLASREVLSLCPAQGTFCRRPNYILNEIANRKRATRQTNHGGRFDIKYPEDPLRGLLWDGPSETSDNVHYSWDWHDVHFVQLNLFPGDTVGPYETLDPGGSLSFLRQDLATYVGTSGRPVVLIHHYGFDCFSINGFQNANKGRPCYLDNLPDPGEWWTVAQRADYWNAIRDYNVVAIFAGHLHQTQEDGDAGWRIPFDRPAASLGRPDGRTTIPSFIAGAARGSTDEGTYLHHTGVFLDVSINACNQMLVTRKDVNGTILPNRDGQHYVSPGSEVELVEFASPLPAAATCSRLRCQNVAIAADGQCQGTVSVNGGSMDPLGGTLACNQSPSGPYGLGDTSLTLACVSSVSQRSASCEALARVLDQTPPTLDCAPRTLECNDRAGHAAITLAPAASDNCTPQPKPECGGSGSYPLGFTAAFCQAYDAAGNGATCYVNVTVVDTIAPAITCPADITVEPTSPAGAMVTFTATAMDGCDPAPAVACPASGTTFALGATVPASCTATDHASQQGACGFMVHVRSVAETGGSVKQRVAKLRAAGVLSAAQGDNLRAGMDKVLAALAQHRVDAACQRLQGVSVKVTGFVASGALPAADGQSLLDSALHMSGALGCA
jgi:hypothetical protein